MAAPKVYAHPIKRPSGFLSNARFEGDDDELLFHVDYPDSTGAIRTITFRLHDDGSDKQEMCIVNSNFDLNNIPRDTMVAHIRCCGWISKTLPGSKEWDDAIKVSSSGQTKWFQTAVGQVKVTEISIPDDECIHVEFQRGSQEKVTITIDIDELTAENYSFDPETQLSVIAGSVEKEFPGYHHEGSSNPLNAQERADIINYVNDLQPGS